MKKFANESTIFTGKFAVYPVFSVLSVIDTGLFLHYNGYHCTIFRISE